VRYFDLRIAQRDDKFYYCHGLFAMEIFEPLLEIRQFVDSHPEELVILDLQHFYALTVAHHQQLHKDLIQFFGHRLYSTVDGSLKDCTLNRLVASGLFMDRSIKSTLTVFGFIIRKAKEHHDQGALDAGSAK